MTKDLERLVVRLEANIDKYQKGVDKALGITNKQFTRIEKRGKTMNKKLSAHFAQTSRAISMLPGPLSRVASSMSGLTGAMGLGTIAFGAAAVAIGGLILGSKKATDAFAEFQRQQMMVQQLLKTTGQASGMTADKIEELAQSIAQGTLASLTDARAAAAQLLTFKSVAGDTFEQTLRLAQDLAANGFGTISSSAVQLGKALEDPATGLTALRRVGVSFSQSQKDLIMQLHNTGQTAEAQKEILNGLAGQIGGAGTSSAGGLTGAYDSLAVATQNLLVQWGAQIFAALQLSDAINAITSAINGITAVPTLQEQIVETDQQIAKYADRVDEFSKIRFATGVDKDRYRVDLREYQKFVDQKTALQLRIKQEGIKANLAEVAAAKAALAAQKERTSAAVSAVEERLRLSKLTAEQRQNEVDMAKAGVTAETEAGQKIIQINRDIYAAKKAAGKSSGGKQNKFEAEAEGLLEEIAAFEAQYEALAAVNPLLDENGEAAARSAAQHQLLIAAQKQGLEITPQLAAHIEALSSKYAASKTALDQLQQSHEDAREAMQRLEESSKEVFKGFISDLREGKSATEALGNALDRIGDKLVDMAIDKMFEGLFAGIGGSLGSGPSAGTGGRVGAGIFHRGGQVGQPGPIRNVPAAAFAGAPRFHNGANLGLRRNEIPAILERGEVVLSNRQVRAIAGSKGQQGQLPAPKVSVTINNNAGVEVQQQSNVRPDGGVDIDLQIDRIVAQKVMERGSEVDRALQVVRGR